MNFKQLLLRSKDTYAVSSNHVEKVISKNLFQSGANWMAEKMNVSIAEKTHFNQYGFFKYGICLIAFVLFFCFLLHRNIFLTPLSIVVFYFFEVHFLFLFPLLIDRIPNPIRESIKISYKIGILKAMFIVMQLSFFMLIGLFCFKNPFKNWHIGCLCIVIWYEDEIRNRL